MSLIRPVIRLCACAALDTRTLAETRVFDSDNTPLDEILKEGDAPLPYIVVYTDLDNRIEISGTDVYSARRQINLVVEIAVGSRVKGEGISTPHTDPGMEMAIDLVEGQALAALVGDPLSEWGELFKLLVSPIVSVNTRRGGRGGDTGIKWAARQIVLQCEAICDPPPGVPTYEDHPIRRFIELARLREPQTQFPEAADLIEAMLSPTAAPTWRQAQAWLGLARRGIRATGMAPLADDAAMVQPTETPESIVGLDGEGPALHVGTVDNEDEAIGGGGTTTEADPVDWPLP